MGISTLVISDVDRFVEMKDFWDRELRDHVDNPLLSSFMLEEYWKQSQSVGWHPFLIIFLLGDKIVGFAPLAMRSRFGFRHVCNLHPFIYPDFFSDDIREVCVEKMVDFFFGWFNCESVDLTFEDGSVNQSMLEKICGNKGFNYYRTPEVGEAILPVETSYEEFQKSLGCNIRKKFRKASKKVVGSWQVYGVKVDSISIQKIWEIEKHSWKNSLQGKDKTIKNLEMMHTLNAVQRNGAGEPFFDSEVWFLDLEGVPISYQLVLKRNKRAFFLKTSYDSRFKEMYPGKFLINELIERVFREQTVNEIDFITNLPFVNDWKPSVRNRTTIKIKRNPIVSKLKRLLFENQISNKLFNFLENLKWQKLHP